MLDGFVPNPIPDWLATLTAENIDKRRFPLHDILQDSLYYPSSGFDGRPVQYLGGYIVSFIHVDYGRSRTELDEQLASEDVRFKGYEILATREVTQRELTPNGWIPTPPRPGDGNPARYRDAMKTPYCAWFVFERIAGFGEDHGPKRFSLLHLCADGVATFQALYHSNKASPKAIAIIAPGTGFGLNWTDYRDPRLILHRSVMEGPSQPPELFMNDSKTAAYWPQYTLKVAEAVSGITIWRRPV
jgi:hypothetical protein